MDIYLRWLSEKATFIWRALKNRWIQYENQRIGEESTEPLTEPLKETLTQSAPKAVIGRESGTSNKTAIRRVSGTSNKTAIGRESGISNKTAIRRVSGTSNKTAIGRESGASNKTAIRRVSGISNKTIIRKISGTSKKTVIGSVTQTLTATVTAPANQTVTETVTGKATVNENLPENITEILPDPVPETLSETLPEILSEILPENLPEILSEILPEVLSETLSKNLPDTFSETFPETLSQNLNELTKISNDKSKTTIPPIKSNMDCKKMPRRTRIPDKPNVNVHFWSILKEFVGKDISRISLPVCLHEPISLLQRLSEMFQYSPVLDKAAECKDLSEQICYVAAFAASGYAVTDTRLTKPFNPILGETFDLDRTDDLGWRLIGEQVSHHPPISAIYCTAEKWQCSMEFQVKSSFTGNSIEVTPLGTMCLKFKKSNSKYILTKQATTRVSNVLVGSMYMDHYGNMEITGRKAALKINCILTFFEKSKKHEYGKVEGKVIKDDNQTKFLLKGHWNKQIEIAPVLQLDAGKEDKVQEYRVIWTRTEAPEESSKYYNFSVFTCQLNEVDLNVAPTDSRFRPDQRLMEEGDWDGATKKKHYLQVKQREANKAGERPPVWFKRLNKNEQQYHVYGEEYWSCKNKKDWSRCPDIF